MWMEIIIGIGFLFVFEGIMPFLNPSKYKEFIFKILGMQEQSLRIMGLILMLLGVIIVYSATHFFN